MHELENEVLIEENHLGLNYFTQREIVVEE